MRPLRWLLLAGTLPLAACDQASPAVKRPAAAASHWPERQLGESRFYVALPDAYALTAVNAPAFVTYNFAPADTLAAAAFTGGICFNYYPLPGRDAIPDAGCPSRRWPVAVLGQPEVLQMRNCHGRYLLTGLVECPALGQGPREKLYVFGEAMSRAGLHQLTTVFASLRRRKF